MTTLNSFTAAVLLVGWCKGHLACKKPASANPEVLLWMPLGTRPNWSNFQEKKAG